MESEEVKSLWEFKELMHNRNNDVRIFFEAFLEAEITRPNLLNDQDSLGWTLLHCAVGYGREDIKEFLVEQGADQTLRNDRDQTALEMEETLKKLPLWNAPLQTSCITK